MSSTTHRIAISEAAYVNVSNGNLNCSLFLTYRQDVRICIAGAEPEADTAEFFTAGGGMTAAGMPYSGHRLATRFNNLLAEDDIWVRSEGGGSDVIVVRGDVQMQ